MALGKIGKYDRVDVLGHGATGIVYLAVDTLLKKQIALKEIDIQSGDLHRFLEEARVMDRMHHPNIVRVNGVDQIDGHILIDMEYVQGQTLQKLLRKEGRLAPERAVKIIVQALDALDYAHSMRTVHRDIKPANMLISDNDEVKLVDFGLAEILATNSYAGGAGTYAYMAPEDFAEDRHSDHQSDIWAVGITLYEMLTGARPFQVSKPRDPFSWRKTLLENNPIPLSEYLPDTPSSLQAVLDKALGREKAQRYFRASDFQHELMRLLERGDLAGLMAPVLPLPKFDLDVSDRSDDTVDVPLSYPKPHPTPIPTFASPVGAAATTAAATRTLLLEVPAQQAPMSVPNKVAQTPKKSWLPFGKKEITAVEASVEPDHLNFGVLKKGDERTLKCSIQFKGGDGRYEAQVVDGPSWIRMTPLTFQRKKQTLTLTAVSERAWQTGDFTENLTLNTTAGVIHIPLALTVLKPRLRFSQVSIWFVPLFLSVILPAITLLWGMRFGSVSYLTPAVVTGCGLLSCMLLLVTVEADLGVAEKSAAAILTAIFGTFLGIAVKLSIMRGHYNYLSTISATGVPIGTLLIVQCFTRRYWKLWAGLIFALAAITVGIFGNAMIK